MIIRTTGPFQYRSNRAHDPDRLFFDILRARPLIEKRRYATHIINDALVRRVRIAETTPGTTRIVFDLAGPADFRVSRLRGPDRMVVDILPPAKTPEVAARRDSAPALPAIAPQPYNEALTAAAAKQKDTPFIYPPPKLQKTVVLLPAPALEQTAVPSAAMESFSVNLPGPVAPHKYVRGMSTRVMVPARKAIVNAPAAPSGNATRSLTRALGLKINRVVIDAGHGGQDDGTIGRHGLLEKDVVLDVALRLAALIQNRLGAEVVLTRSDDTFIPLHERTAIANDHKADLFLSIHANSSPSPEVAGIEVFYLNFTNNSVSLDVAARENAGSEKTVGELRDLIQSITLNDKITESQTFARDIETPLFTQAASANAAAKDRGVKRAPFVVLIGASMPSVLAEIGFLSNSRDERNLSKPEYRQRIAEALYRGVADYSKSLSHFEVAASASPRVAAHGN